MSWQVELERRAEHELTRLPDETLQRIVNTLLKLREEPFPHGSKKLQGGGGYRLRVGDYRILYDVINKERKIVIYAVGHRRDIYRR